MSEAFDARKGLIRLRVRLHGPSGSAVATLALDTGATSTTIDTYILVSIGCDPALSTKRVRTITASGVVYAPRLHIETIEALGQVRSQFPVLALTLPPSTSIDGVIGLDFLRNRILTVDFQDGFVTLT